MKHTLFFFLFFLVIIFRGFSQNDTLYINYFSQVAFAQEEKGEVMGLEVDIVKQYIFWLKTKKQMNVPVKYVKFTDFNLFYNQTKAGTKYTMGLGSVTINGERLREIDFTPAYLKNVAYCITNGNAPEIKSKTQEEVVKVLGNMTALTLTNSTLNQHVVDIKKSFIPELKIVPATGELKILDDISRNILYFGYVDAVVFWFYLKSNPSKFLKMQKVMSQSKEELGFAIPKGSPHKALFNEFFNGAAGFKKNKEYKAILEKHLGTYMANSMAVN